MLTQSLRIPCTVIFTWVVLLMSGFSSDPVQVQEKCPACSNRLITVPILIGRPNQKMITEVTHGRALLGGCIGNPSEPEKAFACLKCRKSKDESAKLWQDLPKNFGKYSAKLTQDRTSDR